MNKVVGCVMIVRFRSLCVCVCVCVCEHVKVKFLESLCA